MQFTFARHIFTVDILEKYSHEKKIIIIMKKQTGNGLLKKIKHEDVDVSPRIPQ